ncbi:MAG: HXXEE domain-containing protein [Candidatus Acidiferrales bacterium]
MALGLAQAAHSIEEMRMHLYEFFDVIAARLPGFPMRNVSADAFAVNNILIVAGVLALAPFVQARREWALGLAGVVAAIEILNGIGHPGISLLIGQYMPGTYTAPALLLLGALVLRELWRSRSIETNGA